jgi:hypothetical protein
MIYSFFKKRIIHIIQKLALHTNQKSMTTTIPISSEKVDTTHPPIFLTFLKNGCECMALLSSFIMILCYFLFILLPFYYWMDGRPCEDLCRVSFIFLICTALFLVAVCYAVGGSMVVWYTIRKNNILDKSQEGTV